MSGRDLSQTLHMLQRTAVAALALVAMTSVADAQKKDTAVTGKYEVRYEEVSSNCTQTSIALTRGTLAINKKARKLGSYQSHVADEYWLLVVGGEPIVSYVPAGDIRDHVFTSPYKRTLFLDRADRTCFALRTTTP